jgi:tetratricopeptide (TPR) repeat protein
MSSDQHDALFEDAADAIADGDLATLDRLLIDNPELVSARSSRAHGATLLHYVSANGVEDFRQKTPPNIVEIARRLLDAGADVDAEARSFGGGDTTLMLVATSIHPQRAGVQLDLMRLLLDQGAVIPSNAVYLSLANGRGEAAEFLLDRGGLLDLSTIDAADTNGMTLLHHAVSAGSLPIVRMLLDRGAALDVRNRYGGTALEQAIWSAKHARRERLYENARQGYLAAVEVCRASGDVRVLAHTLRHLGDIEREMGRMDDAKIHLVEALDIARREEVAPLELANTVRVLALIRDDEALWREAHALYVRANVPPGIAETARRLAAHAREEDEAEEWMRIARAAEAAQS